MKKPILHLMGIFSLGGLADAIYLYSKSILGTPLSCSLIEGCNIVAASSYSRVWGVPLSLFGVLFYVAVLVLIAVALMRPREFVRRALVGLALVGILFSAYFTYLQAFVIGAFCQYCLISAATSVFLFILVLFVRDRSARTHGI